MQMSENEIARSYRHSKNKKMQIKILADLNACPKKAIEDVLRKTGDIKKTKSEEMLEGAEREIKERAETEKAMEQVIKGVLDEEAKRLAVVKKENEEEQLAAVEEKREEQSDKEMAAVPDVVRRAVNREMCFVQEMIDEAVQEIRRGEQMIEEAEKRLEVRKKELEFLGNFLKIAPAQQ